MVNEKELELFFHKLSGYKYIVLRGYEDLLEDINSGKDIDLLVEDKKIFVELTSAQLINNIEDSYNFFVSVGDMIIPVDLRVVGDGYYDTKWEQKMLNNRVPYKYFYIMNKEDYKYSIFYHCIIHKKRIPSKYAPFLVNNEIQKKNQLLERLNKFMKENGYEYVVPKDKGVDFNRLYFFGLKILYKVKRY